jgi:hypothetical protein
LAEVGSQNSSELDLIWHYKATVHFLFSVLSGWIKLCKFGDWLFIVIDVVDLLLVVLGIMLVFYALLYSNAFAVYVWQGKALSNVNETSMKFLGRSYCLLLHHLLSINIKIK